MLQLGSAARAGLPGPTRLFGAARPRCSGRVGLRVAADGRNKGQRLDQEQLAAGTALGSGSFGECYRGTLTTAAGEQQVVLKRVKARVAGAEEMQQAEHLLNVLASKAAGDAVAPFLGYANVDVPAGRLTKGLWLVWGYQGDKTLAYYLKRRDCAQALAQDLGVDEAAAVPTAMKQIFECLSALHSVGIVHRDIKPTNIVFDERQRRLRLIDLGAAACLRTGTNYKPKETILDPCYCPPEEYVLPTDAPRLAEKGSITAFAMSPLLWQQHSPDCFDTYSAGVVLMQLSLPFLRTTSALRTFNGALARCQHDLEEWRARSGLPARQTAILDANNGAGWDLAASLLRPREVVTDDAGGVTFVNTGKAPRLGTAAALRHPFIRAAAAAAQQAAAAAPAAAAVAASSSSSGRDGNRRTGSRGGKAAAPAPAPAPASKAASSGGVSSMWGRLKSSLFDMEARVMQDATATEVQTSVVEALRKEVKAGRASEAELRQQESVLAGMQRTLQSSVKDMNSAYGTARGFLSGMLGGGGSRGQRVEDGGSSSCGSRGGGSSSSSQRAAPAASDKRMPKWAAKEVPLKKVDASLYASQQRQRSSSADYDLDAEAAEARGEVMGAAVGSAVSTAASMFSKGLKFTGSALSGLSSFAANMSEAAARNATQAAAESALQKQAATAYLEALQQLQPPLTAESRWEELAAAAALPDAPEFAVLGDIKRELVFKSYVDALGRAARAKSLAAFQELMVAAEVDADSRFPEFVAAYAGDARYNSLATESERREAFGDYTGRLQAAAEAAARAATRAAARAAEEEQRRGRLAAREAARAAETASTGAAEVAYRQLMQEHKTLIEGGAGYPQLKLMMWADARFDAVPEERRKQLYDEFYGLLEEAGLLTATSAAGGAATAAEALQPAAVATAAELAAAAAAAVVPGATPVEAADPEQLEWLRQEQSRLKEEYAKMEAKLRDMEQRMQLGVGSTAVAAVVTPADDGTTIFRFEDSLASAAELANTIASSAAASGSAGTNGSSKKTPAVNGHATKK